MNIEQLPRIRIEKKHELINATNTIWKNEKLKTEKLNRQKSSDTIFHWA